MSELQPLIPGRDAAGPLFLNRYGDAMTRFGIHAVVARHTAAAAEKLPSLKTKRISPYTIRHTTATHLLRAGVDLNAIRAWLGHVSVDTTSIYAETDLAMKAKALATCDPGGGHRRKKKWRDDPNLMEFLASYELGPQAMSLGVLMDGRWRTSPSIQGLQSESPNFRVCRQSVQNHRAPCVPNAERESHHSTVAGRT
jgi:hypothetical protein